MDVSGAAQHYDAPVHMQTRRVLLTRLAQVGLLAAGLEIAEGCDRLPGQAARMPRIGLVANLAPPGDPDISADTQSMIAGLADYGYIPGQNLDMDSRFPSDATQNSEMIGDLLRLGVDVLVTGGTAATVTAKQATSIVPIVAMSISDPVALGLVQSLARPGSNVTGISLDGVEYTGKWLELLLQIEPTLRRIGYLYNPDNPGHVAVLGQLNTLAATSGLQVLPATPHTLAELDAAVETLVANGAEALIQSASVGADGNARVAALALSHHLVSLGVNSFSVAEGILLSYTPDYVAMWRRGAYFIERILKGAKPADLPVELPTTFDLVVNQATATALGVTIPDEVAQQVTSWI